MENNLNSILPKTPELSHEVKPPLPEIENAEALGNNVKKILVKSEDALKNGNVTKNIETIERWIESYRRGLSAAQKISDNGSEILQKTKDQLILSLNELLRFEDEGGGNVVDSSKSKRNEEITLAIKRINDLITTVEQSFNSSAQNAQQSIQH